MSYIKYFVMDVDGTLTDEKIYIGLTGELFKAFNVKDGYGIKNILIPLGVTPIIITGRESDILKNRCKELGISQLYQGVSEKKEKLMLILGEKIDYSQVAYIGDDINDLECMSWIRENGGTIGCPRNAANKVLSVADFVSLKDGGEGAVRDFIDWLISNNKIFNKEC